MAYPLPKFHFLVKWDPGVRVGFTEVTGLDIQREVIEYREGNSPEFSKTKQPGLLKHSNITCKRGVFPNDSDFYKWVQGVNLDADVDRRDVTISLLDETHNPIMSWKIIRAFPVKFTVNDFKADGNEVAIETLELAHEGLSLIS